MKTSSLQLERYFFSKIELEAHPDGDPELDNLLGCSLEVGVSNDDPRRFQVSLNLKLVNPEGGKAPYTGEFDAVGFFEVSAGWPKDNLLQLVETNGPALLYGALRELIYTLTARGPWPPVTLKSVTFLKDTSLSSSTKKSAAKKSAVRSAQSSARE